MHNLRQWWKRTVGTPARGRILIVDHRTPTPDHDSGSASVFSYLQLLSRAGFDLTFAPFDLADAGEYTRALNRLGIKTLSAPQWPTMRAVISTLARRMDLLLLYRAPIATQLFDVARSAAPATRILFHPVDLHFLRLQREAEISGDAAQAAAAAAVRTMELDLVARADATIVVSQFERDLLRELLPAAPVHQIPILREAPSQPPRSAPHQFNERDILFIGGFEHLPNVDGIRWFVQETWPMLQERKSTRRLIIGGSKMPDAVTSMASDTVDVRGYVRDLAQLFASCWISVAPLRYGAGIKGKIVTSLSYGVPVVATSIAAEGTGLRHDEDILIADSPAAMADAIMRLDADDDLWRRLSANGYRSFQERFSLAVGAPKVLAVVDKLVAMTRR